MKKAILALLVAGAAAASLSTAAEASGGCGPGGHRGYYGACRPNFGPGPVVGGFYPRYGGYWYGNHYWGHRRWYGRGWRYY